MKRTLENRNLRRDIRDSKTNISIGERTEEEIKEFCRLTNIVEKERTVKYNSKEIWGFGNPQSKKSNN